MQPLVLKASYQRERQKRFGGPELDVRIYDGGFSVGHPVNRRFSTADFKKVIRFIKRGLR